MRSGIGPHVILTRKEAEIVRALFALACVRFPRYRAIAERAGLFAPNGEAARDEVGRVLRKLERLGLLDLLPCVGGRSAPRIPKARESGILVSDGAKAMMRMGAGS